MSNDKKLYTEKELAEMCLHLMGHSEHRNGDTIGIDGIRRLQLGVDFGYHVVIVADDSESFTWNVWEMCDLVGLIKEMGWEEVGGLDGYTRYINQEKEGDMLGGHANRGIEGQFQDHYMKIRCNTFLDIVHDSLSFLSLNKYHPLIQSVVYRLTQEHDGILKMVQTFTDTHKGVDFVYHYIANKYDVLLDQTDYDDILKILQDEKCLPLDEFRNQLDEIHTFPKKDKYEIPEKYDHLDEKEVTICGHGKNR